MKRVWILFVFVLFLGAAPLFGADGGSEVIVIYNRRVPQSKAVAEYYASKRGVPDRQVFGFDLNTGLEMSREEFRESLQEPLAKKLKSAKLWRMASQMVRGTNGQANQVVWKVVQSKIRYAVLCYGVPVSIAKDPNWTERGSENLRPEIKRDEAAVDTELALLPLAEERLPVFGPLSNPVFRGTNGNAIHPTNGVLMVTRLDGPTPEIARGLVDKAIEAEKIGMWGRAYFDLRNLTGDAYKMGDDWIRNSAMLCEKLGFETEVDNSPGTFPAEFPMSQIAIYCGWYDYNVSGPFTRREVEFMPGAFAYHLHSFSAANIRSAAENWVGPFLAKGATITMGCVREPYLTGTPEVSIFFARFIYDRMSFGEAAYAAQPLLSWQTTIVGDPLYRPFATPPEQLHERLLAEKSPWAEWSFLRLADINLANGRPPKQIQDLLQSIPLRKESAVLTEKLADLYATLGKPTSAIETLQQALQLNPSPLQRVRLRLKLGEKMGEANLNEAAYENYTELLKENPDYANRAAIYRRLLPLAKKLGKKDDVERYETLLNPPPPAASTN